MSVYKKCYMCYRIFAETNKVYIRSSAAIRCLLYLKWYWKLWFPILWLIPLPVRDTIYRMIAMSRHKIFKKPESCSFRID